MTSEVQPSAATTFVSETQALALMWAAGVDGWIVPNDEVYGAEARGADNPPLNAFDASYSSSSFTVEIDTGEAFVRGTHLWTDETTDVLLDAEENDQIVSIGWSDGAGNDVRIDKEGGENEPEYGLDVWSFDTDDNGVVDSERLLPAGRAQAESDLFLPIGGGVLIGGLEIQGSLDVQNNIESGGYIESGGDISTDENVSARGGSVVISGDEYEIQKDGNDGEGIINFITEE